MEKIIRESEKLATAQKRKSESAEKKFKQHIQDQQSRISSLKEQMASLNSRAESIQKKKQSEIQEKQKKIRELSGALSAADSEKKEMTTEINDLKLRAEFSESESKEFSRENQRLNSEVSEISGKLSKTRDALLRVQNELRKLNEQCESTRKTASEYEEKLVAETKKNQTLEQTIQDMKIEIGVLKTQKEKAEENVKSAYDSLQKNQNYLFQIKKRHKESERQNEDLNDQLSYSLEELERTKYMLSCTMANYSGLMFAKNTLEANQAENFSRIQQMQDTIDLLGKEKSDLIAELKNVKEKQAAEKDKLIELQQKELNELRQELSEMKLHKENMFGMPLPGSSLLSFKGLGSFKPFNLITGSSDKMPSASEDQKNFRLLTGLTARDNDDGQSAVSDIDSDFTESSYTNTSDVSDESLKKEEEKSSGNDEIVKVAEEKKEDGSLLEVEKKEDKSETISLSESDDFSDSFESSYFSSFSLEDIGVQTNESFVETYKKLTADTNYVSRPERAKSCPPIMKRVKNFSESSEEGK